jgi:hypothetical protein
MSQARKTHTKPERPARAKPKKTVNSADSFLDHYDPMTLALKQARGIIAVIYGAFAKGQGESEVRDEKAVCHAAYAVFELLSEVESGVDWIGENWRDQIVPAQTGGGV